MTATAASAPVAANETTQAQAEPILPRPSDRGTEELVIAVVGPIGSGVSECAKIIEDELSRLFGYTSGGIIKVSDLIQRNASKVGVPIDPSRPKERTEALQRAGTELRTRFGDTVVVDLAIAEISSRRPPAETKVADGVEVALPPKSRRYFTLIDSIKHPAEVEQLAAVYKDAFWLVGVFAPPTIRSDRLRDRFEEPEEIVKAMRIDEDEHRSSGQKVAKAMELADYFIRNDQDSKDSLRTSVKRFLEVIFGAGVQTPTKDESAMYAAAAAASKSACLSRQVGAVIVSASGEIIGTGSNDVPTFGGGLYPLESSPTSQAVDNRCFKWGGSICHNDDRKDRLAVDAVKKMIQDEVIGADKQDDARNSLLGSQLKGLIEFSRAVHAEMEAIISVARSGAQGLVGSTLYSTTFPCHSCARHIVAAGIKRVVYIEPYAKSLALDLHKDAISTSQSESASKVLFVQYEGVGPRDYIRLFYNRSVRKRNGEAIPADLRQAVPVLKEPLDDFAVRENIATGGLKRLQAEDAGASG